MWFFLTKSAVANNNLRSLQVQRIKKEKISSFSLQYHPPPHILCPLVIKILLKAFVNGFHEIPKKGHK